MPALRAGVRDAQIFYGKIPEARSGTEQKSPFGCEFLSGGQNRNRDFVRGGLARGN
jgi:hypothetical protein